MKYQDEIKKILRGYNTRVDGFYAAAEGLGDLAFFGSYNGADTLSLRGLYCMEKQYLIPGKLRPALEECVQQLYRMGSPAILRQDIEVVCCLRMRAMGNPVFMVLENKAKVLILYVYTAKTLWAREICRKTITTFESVLTEFITPASTPVEVKKAGKNEKKKEKQTQRVRLKELKIERKEQKLRYKQQKEEIKQQKEELKQQKEELKIVREIHREQLREELRANKTPVTMTKVPIIEGMDGDDADLDIEEYMEHYVRENH